MSKKQKEPELQPIKVCVEGRRIVSCSLNSGKDEMTLEFDDNSKLVVYCTIYNELELSYQRSLF